MTRAKRALLALLVGLSLGLASIEALFRAMGVGFEESMRPDPYTGWSLQPNAAHWDQSAHQFQQINSDGLRDVEHHRAKLAGTWRLAVLGDSFTQGREAKLEEIFPRVLEGRLRDCRALAGRRPEVVNFGVAGYGTAQELLTLQHRVWDYHPDAILLAFYDGNDVADNHPRLASDSDYRPFFSFGDDGRLSADFRFRDSARYHFETSKLGGLHTRLKRHLRVWQVASRALLLLELRWSRPEYRTVHSRELGVVPGALAPPRDAVWEEAWRMTEGILLLMRDETRAHGARLFVFTVSAPIQVDPDPRQRHAEAERLGVPDLLYPERRLAEFAARSHITFFPLIEPMQQVSERDHVYLHGLAESGLEFQHWNGRGHALAAELLEQRICEDLGVQVGSTP